MAKEAAPFLGVFCVALDTPRDGPLRVRALKRYHSEETAVAEQPAAVLLWTEAQLAERLPPGAAATLAKLFRRLLPDSARFPEAPPDGPPVPVSELAPGLWRCFLLLPWADKPPPDWKPLPPGDGAPKRGGKPGMGQAPGDMPSMPEELRWMLARFAFRDRAAMRGARIVLGRFWETPKRGRMLVEAGEVAPPDRLTAAGREAMECHAVLADGAAGAWLKDMVQLGCDRPALAALVAAGVLNCVPERGGDGRRGG